MQAPGLTGSPLYLQISTRLKHQIAAGILRQGDRLPSLREGAECWQVNLHTVRRAYRFLEADGYVRTSPRSGTRVVATGIPEVEQADASADEFVAHVARTAALRFGMDVHELARRLTHSSPADAGPVWVLECSESLAFSLAEQIAAWSGRAVTPWVLRKGAVPPRGLHLSTYYHFAEVRRLVAHRTPRPAFFGVRIDRTSLNRIRARTTRGGALALLAVDPTTGSAIAAELAHELKRKIRVELHVTRRPRSALRAISPEIPVVVTPQNWDHLTEDERRAERVFPLLLNPVAEDLRRIADAFGWRVAVRPAGGARRAARRPR